jgi:two-component system chemotaxis response regulator CheB
MTIKTEVFLIGGSAGSLKVLLEMLPNIKEDLSFPIVIILHRKGSSDSMLAELLNSRTKLTVVEAEEKEKLVPGFVYLAPPDYHLLIEKDQTISLDFSEKLNYSRPSIDITFISASEIFGKKTTALLLSGANADGVDGLNIIKQNSGTTLVQDPLTAEVDYMPKQAIIHAKIDFILEPKQIAAFINQLNV